jgi:hypothetical protein
MRPSGHGGSLVRSRRQTRAEAHGFALRTRARFGFTAPAGSSDDPRARLITQCPSGEVARELFAARDAGGGEQQQTVLARPPGHAYSRDGGLRAHGLGIASTDAESADSSIDRPHPGPRTARRRLPLPPWGVRVPAQGTGGVWCRVSIAS